MRRRRYTVTASASPNRLGQARIQQAIEYLGVGQPLAHCNQGRLLKAVQEAAGLVAVGAEPFLQFARGALEGSHLVTPEADLAQRRLPGRLRPGHQCGARAGREGSQRLVEGS